MMKISNLGQTIGILANVGVVIGMVLLAIEISQANRQAAADAYQARISEREHVVMEYALSEHLPRIYTKLTECGLDSLSAEEISRLTSWEIGRSLRFQGQFNQVLQGFLDPEVSDTVVAAAARRMGLWDQLGIRIEDSRLLARIEEVAPTVPQISRFDGTVGTAITTPTSCD